MQRSIIYRRIAAAVFLLLYTFIATPVQLWHQHVLANKEKPGYAKITAGKPGIENEDCKICQHTYETYINDEGQFFLPAQTILTHTNSFFKCRYAAPAIQDASNKSPPQV